MNDYIFELQQEIDFMNEQLGYIETLIQNAAADNDTKEYARLMRLYLPLQKSFLKACAECEKLDNAANNADPLLDFAGTQGLSA